MPVQKTSWGLVLVSFLPRGAAAFSVVVIEVDDVLLLRWI